MRRMASPVSSDLRVVAVGSSCSRRTDCAEQAHILSLTHTLLQDELPGTWPVVVRPRTTSSTSRSRLARTGRGFACGQRLDVLGDAPPPYPSHGPDAVYASPTSSWPSLEGREGQSDARPNLCA